jgi:hypothetical protein
MDFSFNKFNSQFGDLSKYRYEVCISESEIPTKDLSSGSYSRPLPLEMNCEIFGCLKLPIQRKFICGLGRGIYGISRQKVLKKVFY